MIGLSERLIQKGKSPTVYVILCLAILIQYLHVTDRHTTTAYTTHSSIGSHCGVYLLKHFGNYLKLVDFYRATAMLSAVYAVVVCLCVCVCHTPVLYQNG